MSVELKPLPEDDWAKQHLDTVEFYLVKCSECPNKTEPMPIYFDALQNAEVQSFVLDTDGDWYCGTCWKKLSDEQAKESKNKALRQRVMNHAT